MQAVSVIKLDGSKEPYNETKLLQSLIKCGASQSDAQYVVNKVSEKIRPNITTRKIYSMACQYLNKKSYFDAATYNLKKAIRGLGNSGYHFEKFMGKVFEAKGYKVSFNQVLQGKCVNHEVDFIGVRDDHILFAECKFHKTQSKKNDIKIALYIQARNLDLKASKNCPEYDDFYLISNTGFSKDAIKYANCVGLNLFGINYPDDKSVPNIIKRYRLHPISSLKKLRVRYRESLLEKNIVTCKDLLANTDILNQLGINQHDINEIIAEAKRLTIK